MAAIVPRYGDFSLAVGILYGREDRVLHPLRDGMLAEGQIAGAVLELIDGATCRR